ncbi:PREDICTED: uncharacterized protein LOC106336017 isoform X1 [Brassica oleracea var. oleracea]|uniref:Uncharacterized protein n=1 Tax=Brassica oleracea var. oleracea TaxID=109376 RepID=A0A0D3BES9_BRAOL|nr:PREDICTED: uncharacterized protein LOC106336017 isoform X1 [Brassica oleracea var. oleracea]
MFREAGLRSIGEDHVGSRWTIGNRKLDAKSVSNANGVKASHGFGLRTAPPVPSAAARGNYKNGGSSSDMDIASDSDEETYERHHSPQDYKTHVRFPHVAAAHNGGYGAKAETLQEAETFGVMNNNISSHNECETRRNVEAGTTGRNQNGTITSTTSLPPRFPTFHASEQGPWSAMIAYEACMRLCLHSMSVDRVNEASYFLNNECKTMRKAFSLEKFFLQSEEELLGKGPCELVTEPSAPKNKKTIGKIRVQVRKIKMGLDPPPGCNIASLTVPKEKLVVVRRNIAELNLTLSSGWKAAKKVHVTPRVPLNGSFSRQSLAYVQAAARYLKQVSKAVKNEVVASHTGQQTYETVQETYSCSLRLKSSAEEDQIKTQPGSSEAFIFLPDSLGDDLISEVRDSKGQLLGRVVVQLAAIVDDPNEKVRWWPIYHEPEHEHIGRIQLHLSYSSSLDEKTKCGLVAETSAYDIILEVAMKAEQFQRRNLVFKGPWLWMITRFASYYGISDAYARLRYLSYVMDVASPTKDCLDLIYDFLLPIIMKSNHKSVLSHQENRLLGEIDEQIQQILASAFENYKSLDELSFSGMKDVFESATGTPAPAIESSVRLYALLNDVLTPEAQLKLCRYFQAASKKRSIRHLLETNDLLNNRSEGAAPVDPMALTTSYQKMKSLILSFKNEISTDIAIHNCSVLPSYIDLPNLSASIYSVDLCNRLREFLLVWPPPGPSPPVVDLVITTADFQRDITSWNINPIKGGVNAKELFYSYITNWIEEKRRVLYELCKLETVKPCGDISGLTSPFVDEMYQRLNGTLDEYDIIIRRWPEYAISLEKVVADAEKAIVEAMEKQFAEIISPLKESKIFGLKIVKKFTKGAPNPYAVPKELGVLLNSMKRVLDILRPSIENRFKSWNSYIPDGENRILGERLSEVTVLLRAKFRSYTQALVEKLAENTRIQNHMKLKSIIHDLRETTAEPDVRNRMMALKDVLDKTIDHLHSVFLPDVFVSVCRGIWDRLGQDVLRLLEDRKDNVTWHKGPRIAVSVLDEIFATQMQSLLGNALKPEHLEPPRSMMELRSMLCKDSKDYREGGYNY